jgi:DNA repair protein RadC
MLPREKFFNMGIDSLSDEELVSVLIGSGVKGFSFDVLSKKVMGVLKGGSISFEKMKKVKGLGKVKCMQILCAIELGRRIYTENYEKVTITNSERAFNELRYLVNRKQEYLVCLFLNARYELLEKKTVSIGTVDGLNISPRDIIVAALKLNSVYVILAHNHPSGISKPSEEDIVVNENIKRALELVGIKVLDHLVVSKNGWESVG